MFPRADFPGAYFTPSYWPSVNVPGQQLTWHPVYPDQALPTRRRPTAQTSAFAPLPLPPLGLATFPVATFPAQIPRAFRWQTGQRTIVYPPTLPSLLKDWAAIYPDRVPARRPVTWSLSIATIHNQSFFAVPALSWHGTAPDWIARRQFSVAAQLAGVLNAQSALPIPNHAWAGTYPDRIAPRVSVPVASQPVFTFWPEPLREIAIDRKWMPVFPDQVWRLASLQPASQRAWMPTTVDPIVNPPAPAGTEAWAVFPHPVLRASVRRPFGSVVLPLNTTAVETTFWLRPIATPVRLAWSAARLPAGETPAFGAQLGAATQGQWRPSYPDRLARPRRVLGASTTGWRIDPPVLLTTVTCVEWTAEVVGRATFTEETQTRSTLTTEVAGRSTLTEESLC